MNKLLFTIATLFAYSGIFAQTWNTGTGAWISPLSKNIGIQKSLQVGDNVGTDTLWCKTDLNYFEGNVGIGTTTPEAKLHVSISDTLGNPIAHFENNIDNAIITVHTHSDSSAFYGLQTEDFNSALGLSGTTGEVILLTGLGSVAIEIDTTGITNVLQNLSISNGTASQGKLYFVEDQDNGTNTVVLKTPASLAASYDITLPADDGSGGQVLTTNGSGVTSWSNKESIWDSLSGIAIQWESDSLDGLNIYRTSDGFYAIAPSDSTLGLALSTQNQNSRILLTESSGVGNVNIDASRIGLNAPEVIIDQSSSPASGAACESGQITWDASYIYVCTASGAWKRAALTGGY